VPEKKLGILFEHGIELKLLIKPKPPLEALKPKPPWAELPPLKPKPVEEPTPEPVKKEPEPKPDMITETPDVMGDWPKTPGIEPIPKKTMTKEEYRKEIYSKYQEGQTAYSETFGIDIYNSYILLATWC